MFKAWRKSNKRSMFPPETSEPAGSKSSCFPCILYIGSPPSQVKEPTRRFIKITIFSLFSHVMNEWLLAVIDGKICACVAGCGFDLLLRIKTGYHWMWRNTVCSYFLYDGGKSRSFLLFWGILRDSPDWNVHIDPKCSFCHELFIKAIRMCLRSIN